MKKRFLLLITIVPLLAAGLDWAHSYDQAVAKAKQEHKNIMVFIEATHCPYCDKMKEEVLSKEYMPHALEEFIPLILDISSADAKKHFPKAYVTPTTYFITPEKKILEEAVGALTEEFFLWRIDAAEKAAKRLGENK